MRIDRLHVGDQLNRFQAALARNNRRWRVYAPHGLAEVFNLVARPNPVLAPRSVYEAKVSRWRRQWPALTALPWPGPAGGAA